MKKRMILKSSILASLILLIAITISCTQNNSKGIKPMDKSEEIEKLLGLYEEYDLFKGSALIAHEGKIILKNGYGSLGKKNYTENSQLRLASISKQFTAVLVLQMVAEGKLDLNTPISTYISDFPKEKADQITIHHLLSHSDGIPEFSDIPEYKNILEGENKPEEIISLVSELPLLFTPGKRFEYGNSGYLLLGSILEKVGNKNYGALLQEKILDPLNMKNSGFITSENPMDSDKDKTWIEKLNVNYFTQSSIHSAGGIYSSAEDLQTWDQALYSDELLSEEYRNMLFQKHYIAGGRHYGYGWFINQLHRKSPGKPVETFSHGGYTDGFKADITRIPSSKSLVIVLNDLENLQSREISNAILCILYDQPYELPKKPITKTTLEIIQKDGIQAGISYFDGVINKSGICSTENQTLALGYTLLEEGKAEEASEIFKICMREFSNSSLGYESYAEAQLSQGNTDEAIKFFKKALELNPENSRVTQALEKIKN